MKIMATALAISLAFVPGFLTTAKAQTTDATFTAPATGADQGYTTMTETQVSYQSGNRYTPDMGVTSERIERNSNLMVTRLASMQDGGVMVTYSTPFQPGEVLTIDQNNKPVLKTVGANGVLTQHPSRSAAVVGNDIMLVDNTVNVADLQDNPFPASTFNEGEAVNTGERTVGLQQDITQPGRPLVTADFDRPLPGPGVPVARTLGGTSEIPVSRQTFVAPNLILPQGYRTVVTGGSVMILDQNGVIQEVFPAGWFGS